jgi:hypothetical protein
VLVSLQRDGTAPRIPPDQRVIVVGIDDTDVQGSPGTNQLARLIVSRLGSIARASVITRHQLFFDPRVPYTTGNGSASIRLPYGDQVSRAELLDRIRTVMQEWYVEGSDPGLAAAERSTPAIDTFAAKAKAEVVTQDEARAVAAEAGCHLEGLGGTNQGIIGALSAIALAYGGNDGRVVHVDGWPWPDEVKGVQPITAIRERVADVRLLTGEPFTGRVLDLGKHVRPNWSGGRIVLFVEPPAPGEIPRAARIK